MKLFKRFSGCCHRMQRYFYVKRATKKLGLNQEQKLALEHLIRQLYTSRSTLSANCSDSKNQLLDLLADNQLDRSKAEAMLQTHLAGLNSHCQTLIAGFADFFDNLADNQRQQLRDNMQSCNKHHCGRCY